MKKFMVLLIGLFLFACSGRSTTTSLTPSPGDDPITLPLAPSPAPNLPWNGRNLTGSLIFVRLQPGKVDLQKLNLITGEQATLFTAPEQGWLSHAAVSPDGSQVVLAYAPPPGPNQVQFGYSDLYLMPANGPAELQLLSRRILPNEVFFNPIWSSDGNSLYYTHITPGDAQQPYTTNLERLNLTTNQITIVAENGIWPRLSADGRKLAYITTDLQTLTNRLYLADADGTNATLLVSAEQFAAVDAPLFSPDGTQLYFSVVPLEVPASISWWDNLLGVQTAVAHALPSDWWRVPVAGGRPEQLTTLQQVGLYGAFAPDGRTIAFTAQTGLYLMNPDGSGILELLETAPTAGLSWIP